MTNVPESAGWACKARGVDPLLGVASPEEGAVNCKSTVAIGCYAAVTLAAVLGMSWNHLQAPPNDDRPGTVLMFVVGVLTAAIARGIANESPARVVLGVGLAMATGVALDAIIHFFIPPETGNLWPLGVVAVGIMGALAGLAGWVIGGMSRWVVLQVIRSDGR